MASWTAIIGWFAVAVGLLGMIWRVGGYVRAPLPNPIPLTPAPRTYIGVLQRLILEGFLFRSLLRADPFGWLLGWTFHVALLLTVVRHLWLIADLTTELGRWVLVLYPAGPWLSGCLLGSVLGLGARRVFVARIRYISAPADYLWLGLLLGLGGTGVVIGYVDTPNLAAVRHFALAWLVGNFAPLPQSGWLFSHLMLAAVLIFLLPFGKLMHAPGVFLSPTFAAREQAKRGPDGQG